MRIFDFLKTNIFSLSLLAFLIWLIAYELLASHWLICSLLMVLATLYIYELKKPAQSQLKKANSVKETKQNEQLNINKLVEAQIYPTLILDDKDNILCSNQAMQLLFKTPLGKTSLGKTDNGYYVGLHLSSLIRAPQIIEFFEQVKESRNAAEFNFELNSDGGRHFWLHIAPVSIKHGQIFHSLTFRDLTKEQKVNQMRADFIANASHELRTPLASISGFIETLQGVGADDKTVQQKFLNIMGEQASRMTRLIDDLLSLSKIEMNIHTVPQNVVDLIEIAEHASHALAPIAADKNIKLRFEKHVEKALIKGDRDQLIQLFSNLLDNAFKYGVINGREQNDVVFCIDILNTHKYCIVIEDFGNGIPKTDLPRLTERFYRVSNADKVNGTGLGLAIVKHIIGRHDAKIRFDSEIGHGTKVSLTFNKYS